jgi:glycosyltransferase involved in cell wall biosynthesis
VTIGQLNHEGTWYRDELAERYRNALRAALRCYFVSHANLRLCEKQIGAELPNAEVVWNPVNISDDALPAWPRLDREDEVRFACVARLYPPGKGQDILFEALAAPSWAGRRWRLYLYGEGRMRGTLERLAARLGLSDRIVFAGFKSVEEIWAANHVLVMPSRYEGLPLAMVEAMLCARPVVATDVAGHGEIVEDGVTGFLAEAPTAASMAAALERFWERRSEAEAIGKAGAQRIRQLVPRDPVRLFTEKLKHLAGVVARDGSAASQRQTAL